MNHEEDIRIYGEVVNDTELSPFETIEALHIRSELHEQYSNLSSEEKRALFSYDLKLLRNADAMVQHIQKVYNFSKSTNSIQEWWWHLDKITTGKIHLSFFVEDNNI
ncbi:hypothetical protein [Bacillus cereus group sp. TH152-1LC]|uniref:hypothetical protein n=1 Tax=Bacillus cereus group sp. TH152-1LC TaxID=3018060 RepID=UPI0022E29B3C|nr:hypothetical protein [Bacillus cereus group sp. TH152-1LC]MDA1675544.1 hypothetical protein [Bacillus cereus group sp. TH152-1LC]